VRTWAGTLTRPRPVPEALAQVGLTGRADVRVRSLSGGERRRLDLALALLGRPGVVVLDEPTTGLDPESRRQVWALVQGLVADGAAVLLTTHHLEEAEELADRVAIMRAGQIVLSGTQAEIAETQPATIRFTLDDDAPQPPVPAGAQAIRQGRRVEWHTRALQPVSAELLAWAAGHGVVLRTLLARAGSLEQAFLAVADGADPHATAEENR
ncbi:multidrug ABC transporter ATP-binding protein, partial [Modestobacter sp. VKM Ac-2676]